MKITDVRVQAARLSLPLSRYELTNTPVVSSSREQAAVRDDHRHGRFLRDPA